MKRIDVDLNSLNNIREGKQQMIPTQDETIAGGEWVQFATKVDGEEISAVRQVIEIASFQVGESALIRMLRFGGVNFPSRMKGMPILASIRAPKDSGTKAGHYVVIKPNNDQLVVCFLGDGDTEWDTGDYFDVTELSEAVARLVERSKSVVRRITHRIITKEDPIVW